MTVENISKLKIEKKNLDIIHQKIKGQDYNYFLRIYQYLTYY